MLASSLPSVGVSGLEAASAACSRLLLNPAALPHLSELVSGVLPSRRAPSRQVRYHGNHAHGHGHPHDRSAVNDAADVAPEKLKKHLRDSAQLPWEVKMHKEQAAKVLGSYLGVPDLPPATVLALTTDQTEAILDATTNKGDKRLEDALFSYADSVTNRFFDEQVFYRGIVEFSNVCQSDCGYCGIRKHQTDVKRYTIPREEVVEVGKWAFTNGMGTLMLQSGELDTPQRLEYIKEVVRAVRETTIAMDLEKRGLDPKDVPEDTSELGLCVALSVGELDKEKYQQLFDAGARRYLLRIESSNPELFAMLHPAAQRWERRVECLKNLKEVGFQVGTGVMVGLPGQTLRDLASDISFFRTVGADMIGMGPYITEDDTPVAKMWSAIFKGVDKKKHMASMAQLTTRMNALARITLGNVNIAATTALQAIDPMGREIALRRGSNILMPILTPTKYREHYQLYEGKPCITDTADECRNCLGARVKMIGKKICEGVHADPPHFHDPIPGLAIPLARPFSTSASTPSPSIRLNPFSTTPTRPFSTSASAPSPSGRLNPFSTTPARSFATSTHATPTDHAAALGGCVPPASPGRAAPGPIAGSDVPRVNIGVFGIMNAGKSTLMNAITRQETSIVDATPGTTADVKVSLMELHDVGPAKLFDTAGIDESGELGAKKRRKTLNTLKECDIAILVIDVPRFAAAHGAEGQLKWERQVLETAQEYGAVPLVLYNTKGMGGSEAHAAVQHAREVLDPQHAAPALQLDLHGGANVPTIVADFLQDGVSRSRNRVQVKSLPEWALAPNARIFLNIPMDAETPTMRLLRPQALVQEEAIRHWASTTAYRMDLAAARSGKPELVEAERKRFMTALQPFLNYDGPTLMITDSQAVDVVHPWTLDAAGKPLLPFTTFSICMIHRQSGGRLPLFMEGIEAMARVSGGDTILVAEACNHNRITDACNDIGMVQIPNGMQARCGKLNIEHAFGREYPDLEGGQLGKFKLAVHCGGCMIDGQKLRARLHDMERANVPVTNYGLLLSYLHSPDALKRAMDPWGL